ncbi:MAG: lamin tail domain-containing protein [Candidatus Omnitrophota bacterium]|nr:lamin tail domain-containing protein [Candidatus Omnitrophota bacterium]
MIFIHEILADPPSGIAGDANGDGAGSTTQDEFVEVYNSSATQADISGWSLSDSVKTRHVFGPGSIVLPHDLLVIFGGGTPQLTGVNWQIASTGTLGLNNSDDRVSLFDQNGLLVDEFAYGSEAGADESLVRSPEGDAGGFVKHRSLEGAGDRRFSAGTFVNRPSFPEPQDPTGQSENPPSPVPEPSTLTCFAIGLLGWVLKCRARPAFVSV